MIIPVILSGGAGTRLWPLSRELYPKQLLPLVEEQTMLQATVSRLKGLANLGDPIVVCNEEHRFLVAEQLRQAGTPASSIILEPVGRNTAPAAAVAALQAMQEGDDPLLLLLPADHVITDTAALHRVIESALPHAGAGSLVTFGIVPDRPETGYGYIKAGEELGVRGEGEETLTPHTSHLTPYAVAEFVEKPDLATAEAYLAAGDYLWNSGMFLFKASRYLEELQLLAPEILAACRQSIGDGQLDLDFLRLSAKPFAACPSDSIDYAVMEKTDRAVVLPLDAGWSDVGSWSALFDIADKDEQGNVLQGDVLTTGTRNSYVHAGSRLVATVGVEDLVVVETGDAVLVAGQEHVQQVKEIVQRLKTDGRKETALHRRVSRPWGYYETIDHAERFQVKHIAVNPGATLSLQLHHHRAEHWIVVKGTARITRGDETFTLAENQSTYIPLGTLHRLENPGKIPLEIIEIQSGSYLGEDDIERFEDNYGRS